jgi:hypothetical protein
MFTITAAETADTQKRAAEQAANAAVVAAGAQRSIARRTFAGLVGALVFAVLAVALGLFANAQREAAIAQAQSRIVTGSSDVTATPQTEPVWPLS